MRMTVLLNVRLLATATRCRVVDDSSSKNMYLSALSYWFITQPFQKLLAKTLSHRKTSQYFQNLDINLY